LTRPITNNWLARITIWLALGFSCFQILTAAHLLNIPSQLVRSTHVGFLLTLAMAMVYSGANAGRLKQGILCAIAISGASVAVFQWVEYEALIVRAGEPLPKDLLFGVVSLVSLMIASWILLGPSLPIIAALFIAYCLFGRELPDPFTHRGYAFDQVIEHLAYGTEGIYGIPIYVSSTYIFLFILFGSFLERAGMIRLFTDVALGTVGHRVGGAAKVSVMSSAMMGTVSGSAIANVVTTGQFTIPLMKSFGYRAAFAGGVEATASMGGQLMPPVMGAVAFIMAESLGMEYQVVVSAAIVPALLYFGAAFWMVHLEALRGGLRGMQRADLPSPVTALRKQGYLLAPLLLLVSMLLIGYTPLFSGSAGLALTAGMLLAGGLISGLSGQWIRVMAWVTLGLIVAAMLGAGLNLLVLIALLALISVLSQGGRATLMLFREALVEGAKTAVPVALACAVVGIVIGSLTLTGAATSFGQVIIKVGENSLLLSLLLTMLTCLVLGMGVPTIPNYIITASIAGPALLELGVPQLISHMFVFYFGILADLTPPVALACFAASPIAGASGIRVSFEALKVAAAGFVIPFMAVFRPELMLQQGGDLTALIGFWPAVIVTVLQAVAAIWLWGLVVSGWMRGPLTLPLRGLALSAAVCFVSTWPIATVVGLVLSIALLVLHRPGTSA